MSYLHIYIPVIYSHGGQVESLIINNGWT